MINLLWKEVYSMHTGVILPDKGMVSPIPVGLMK